jgi:RimJ/RimL family protein N-acetyltransferase
MLPQPAPPPPYDRPQPTLTDTTVSLRPGRPEDEDSIFRASLDPETARWTTIPQPYTRADARSFLGAHTAMWREGRGGIWVFCRSGSADYAGTLDLRVGATDPGMAEVGFSCAPWARGEGLTTAALRLVCRWGFDTLALGRIEWRAHVGNDASRRVADKAGFRFEGTERARCLQRGRRVDSWLAALLPGDVDPVTRGLYRPRGVLRTDRRRHGHDVAEAARPRVEGVGTA